MQVELNSVGQDVAVDVCDVRLSRRRDVVASTTRWLSREGWTADGALDENGGFTLPLRSGTTAIQFSGVPAVALLFGGASEFKYRLDRVSVEASDFQFGRAPRCGALAGPR